MLKAADVAACRLFLTTHKGFGRGGAWQYWYQVARSVLPKQPDYDDDEPPDAEVKDVTSELLWEAFEQLWQALSVRAFHTHDVLATCARLRAGAITLWKRVPTTK